MNPKKDQFQPIILEFCSALKKEKTMDAVKKFNKNKSNNEKLNATHLDPTLPKKPIFVSESLTQKTQHLFYLAGARTTGMHSAGPPMEVSFCARLRSCRT